MTILIEKNSVFQSYGTIKPKCILDIPLVTDFLHMYVSFISPEGQGHSSSYKSEKKLILIVKKSVFLSSDMIWPKVYMDKWLWQLKVNCSEGHDYIWRQITSESWGLCHSSSSSSLFEREWCNSFCADVSFDEACNTMLVKALTIWLWFWYGDCLSNFVLSPGLA